MAGIGGQKIRQQALCRQRQHVVLHGFHALNIVLGFVVDQGGDALHAVRRHPVLAQEMGIALGRDALVGGGDPALFTQVLRGLLQGQPASPVVLGVPTGCGCHAHQIVLWFANRHFAYGFVSDMALNIGHNHVLHGRVVILEGLQKFADIARLAAAQPSHQGAVVHIQRRPTQS